MYASLDNGHMGTVAINIKGYVKALHYLTYTCD